MSENATFLNPQSGQDEAIALKKAYLVRDLIVGVTVGDDLVVARLAKPLTGVAAKAIERKTVDPRVKPAVTIKSLVGTGRPLRRRGRPPTKPRQSNGADTSSGQAAGNES